MFNYIIPFILTIPLTFIFSEDNRKYNMIFREDFENNNNSWPTDEIKKEKHRINLDGSGARRSLIKKKYNHSGNFVIQSAFYATSKGYITKENQFGIVWGAESDLPDENALIFIVTNTGYFGFYKFENDEFTNLSGSWIESDWINKDDDTRNLLQVFKTNNNYSFYINEYLVLNHEIVPSYGDYVGIYAGTNDGKHTIENDHFYVWEFEEQELDAVENEQNIEFNQENVYTEHQQTQQTSNRTNLIFDDFNGSIIYYEGDNGKVTVGNGGYNIMKNDYWDHNAHSPWSLQKIVNISFDDIDFEIATSMKNINKEDNDKSGYGIFWGGSFNGRENGSYGFYISQFGSYSFSKYFTNEDGTMLNKRDFIPWTVSEHVKTDGNPNEIVIQKIDNMYSFYINGQLVNQAPYEKLIYGDNFGFEKYSGSKDHITFDYISISQLGNSGKEDNIEETFGEYHALLIPINDYQHMSKLRGPIPETEKLKRVLMDYHFKEENITMIPNATTDQIFNALDYIEQTLKPKDNLLIVFSGHGAVNNRRGESYWCPSDSQKYRDMITDNDISGYLKSFQSNNILILADACFSGGILRHKGHDGIPRAPKELHRIKSRRVLSASDDTYSPDPSMFMKYIIKTLEEHAGSYISSQTLFNSIQEPILNNVDKNTSNPQWGPMRQSGDEGGDFIFIKK